VEQTVEMAHGQPVRTVHQDPVVRVGEFMADPAAPAQPMFMIIKMDMAAAAPVQVAVWTALRSPAASAFLESLW
jgi:hypothetical protein